MLLCRGSRKRSRVLDRAPGRPSAWGRATKQLKPRIIGFRAHVRETHARFKLGQDETDVTFAEIVEGHADPELAEWMRRARPPAQRPACDGNGPDAVTSCRCDFVTFPITEHSVGAVEVRSSEGGDMSAR